MKADKTHKAGKVEIESQSVSSKVVKQKQQLYVAVFMNINIRSEDGEKVKKWMVQFERAKWAAFVFEVDSFFMRHILSLFVVLK